MASAYLGVHDQSEGLASSGDIPTGMISGTAFFSQHLLWLASDIIPQVQTLEYESQGHGTVPLCCPPVLKQAQY